MPNKIKLVFTILLAASVSLGIHSAVLSAMGQPPFAHQLIAAYVINALLAAAIALFVVSAPKKLQNSLGYIFLLGSGLKFLVFFVAFLPSYKADGDMQRIEFFTFFIPYFVCLIVETTLVIRHLNRLD